MVKSLKNILNILNISKSSCQDSSLPNTASPAYLTDFLSLTTGLLHVDSWLHVWAKVTDCSVGSLQGPFETEKGTVPERAGTGRMGEGL